MVPAKILVVEDETIVARDIQQSLTRLGYDVPTAATSGEEAIRKTKEIDPDLILMDIVLKGQMDGVETVRQITQQFDVPVIANVRPSISVGSARFYFPAEAP